MTTHHIRLAKNVADKLLAVDPSAERDGGYQGLLVRLGRQTDRATGNLSITSDDLEIIERYRTQYGRGGWQDLLDEIARKLRDEVTDHRHK